MIRLATLFLLLLPACAGTQSGAAFTPRSASQEIPVILPPNKAADHDRALADCIERALEQQEEQDQADQKGAKGPSDPTLRAERDEQPGPAPADATR